MRLRIARARRPKVSVEIITYNQAEFIGQALDGALSQKTSFEYEIVVGDDCSTDGTRELLQAYARKHPARIRLLLHPRRLGPDKPGLQGKNNLLETFAACRGEYVALLEGDDYWTDDRKLAQQVAFLESHPECALCAHAAAIEYSGGRGRHWGATIGASEQRIYTIEDFLQAETRPPIPTASMLFRRRALRNIPAWFEDAVNGDYALQVLLAEQGDVGFLPEHMATHRKHDGGTSRLYDTDPDFINEVLLKLLVTFNEHFHGRYRSILGPQIEEAQRVAAAAAARSLDRPETRIRLPLDAFVTHAGQVVPGAGDRAEIVTPPTAWAYAASLRLPAEAEDRAAGVVIRARVAGAAAGFGVTDRNGDHFLDRRSLEPSEDATEIRLGIHRLTEAGDVVVQTWAHDDSARVNIESIDLVVFAE